MATVREIYEKMDHLYPFGTQMSFDNAGFLVGDGAQEVTSVLVALDISFQVIEEAREKTCQLIVTHHPVIFTPLKSMRWEKPTERMVMELVKSEIAVISAHTNLDRSAEGVNFHLAKALGLENFSFLLEEGRDEQGRVYGTGMMGKVHQEGLSCGDYAQYVAEVLSCKGIRFTDVGRPVSKVAVGGGSCGSLLAHVAEMACDTFVTGDVKYDVFLEAKERGINLLDAGHFPTEQVICPVLVETLQEHFPTVKVSLSQRHQEVSQGIF